MKTRLFLVSFSLFLSLSLNQLVHADGVPPNWPPLGAPFYGSGLPANPNPTSPTPGEMRASGDLWVVSGGNHRKPILGVCSAFLDERDAIGYPCPRLTIDFYDEEDHLIGSAPTKADGEFIYFVDPDRSYHLKIESNQYRIRKNFPPLVKAGEVFLPLEKIDRVEKSDTLN